MSIMQSTEVHSDVPLRSWRHYAYLPVLFDGEFGVFGIFVKFQQILALFRKAARKETRKEPLNRSKHQHMSHRWQGNEKHNNNGNKCYAVFKGPTKEEE